MRPRGKTAGDQEILVLAGGVARQRGEGATDPHAIHRNGEQRVALPGILADLQIERVAAGAGANLHRFWPAADTEIHRPVDVQRSGVGAGNHTVIGDAIDIGVAILGGRAAPGIIEEIHRDHVRAAAPIAQHIEHLVLPGGVRGRERLHAANLHAIHGNADHRIALPRILAEQQHHGIVTGAEIDDRGRN